MDWQDVSAGRTAFPSSMTEITLKLQQIIYNSVIDEVIFLTK